MKIDRTYRNSIVPGPFLVMRGDLPATVNLCVDTEVGEVFIITIPDGSPGFAPGEGESLKVFPWSPFLTVRGIDQVLSHPGVLGALRGVLKGQKDSEDYLWEVLSSEAFWEPWDAVIPMEPWEYFESHSPALRDGEDLKSAAARIVKEALLERIVLDPLLTEMDLEEALWQ